MVIAVDRIQTWACRFIVGHTNHCFTVWVTYHQEVVEVREKQVVEIEVKVIEVRNKVLEIEMEVQETF